MESQTLIAVHDVEASSKWYQQLLGFTSGHGGKEYERLLYNGKLVLQLHAWETQGHDHPFMGKKEIRPLGNGVVLWFLVDDFEAAVKRMNALEAEVLEAPHYNERARHTECWLRDPDGYVVVLASPSDWEE
jgi:extradiol dioxygenase family protein